jgi:hypothetical protein
MVKWHRMCKLRTIEYVVNRGRMANIGAYLEELSFFGSTAGVVTALVAGVE